MPSIRSLCHLLFLTSFINQSTSSGSGIQWIQLNVTMPVPVSDMIATPLGDKIIITGGCTTGNYRDPNSADFYCDAITRAASAFIPASSTFKSLAPMPRERYRHSAAVVKNKLYLIGGRDLADNLIAYVDVYDPVNNTWSTPFTTPDAYLTSDNFAEAFKDVIYLAGGYSAVDYTALNRLVAWNVTSNQYTILKPMSKARGDLGGAIVTTKTNKTMLYVLGGFTDVNDYCAPLPYVERYDISGNHWYSAADMLNARGDMGVALLNQRIFTVGGETKSKTYCTNDVREDASAASLTVNDVESYDPNNDKFLSNPYTTSDSTPWVDENDLFQPLFRSWAAAWPATNTLYVFGGQELYDLNCECYKSSDNVYGFVDTGASNIPTKTSHALSLFYGSNAFIRITSSLALVLFIVG